MAEFTPDSNDDDVYIPQTQTAHRPASRNTLKLRQAPQKQSHSIISLVEADAGATYATAVGGAVYQTSQGTFYPSGGGSLDIFHGSFVFETGLQYREMGFNFPEYGLDIATTGGYLSVPTFLKFYVSGHPENSLFAKLGCYNSFLMTKQETSQGTYNTTTTTNIPLNQFDWAPAVGIGYNMRLSGNMLLVLQASYAYSVTSVFNYYANLYYSVISGTAGIAFKL